MIYSNERFIKAHQDRQSPYYNHSYDRKVRDALCSKCGKIIGEQYNYVDFDKKFEFHEQPEKNDYMHCPYCGHKFKL